jgi:hypothetical protein
MKLIKIFAAAALMLSALSAVAEGEFTFGWNNPDTTFAASGNSTITANSNAVLKLTIDAMNSPYRPGQITGPTSSNFLSYKNGIGETVSLGEVTGIGQEFYVSMSAGESLELYFQNIVNGNTFANDTSWINGLGWSAESANVILQNSFWPDGYNVSINLQGVAGKPLPSGQPLPGTLPTVLICGMAAFVLLNRKIRRAAFGV